MSFLFSWLVIAIIIVVVKEEDAVHSAELELEGECTGKYSQLRYQFTEYSLQTN